MARNRAARLVRRVGIGGASARRCLGRNGMRGSGGVSGAGVIGLCRNLVQGCGRSWADELSAAIEGPTLDAGGTTTNHRGWWWLWLLLLLLLLRPTVPVGAAKRRIENCFARATCLLGHLHRGDESGFELLPPFTDDDGDTGRRSVDTFLFRRLLRRREGLRNGLHVHKEPQRAAVIYDKSAHDRVITIWALFLEGEAREWWNDAGTWAGKDKADISVVAKAFEEQWPNPETSKKKPHQLIADFERITLRDTDVGVRLIDEHGVETTHELHFVRELKRRARLAGDSANLMVPQALAKIPARLGAALGEGYVDIQTWEALVEKTENLSRARLVQADERLKREREIEERLQAAEGRAAATPAQQPDIVEPSSQPMAYPSYIPRAPRSTPSPRFPALMTSPRRAGPTARPFASPRPDALDAAADITPMTSKVIKLSHENTVEGWASYTRAVADWDAKWGAHMLPNASRPYPLRPGTVEDGKCGNEGHFGRDCTATDDQCLSHKETHWRQVKHRQNQQNQQPVPPRTPVLDKELLSHRRERLLYIKYLLDKEQWYLLVFLSTGGRSLFGMWSVAVKPGLLSGEKAEIYFGELYSPDPHDRAPKLGCHEGLCTRLYTLMRRCLHQPAQPRTPGPSAMRSRLNFPTPPQSFSTPSPAFRQRPPHFSQPNFANDVFAMYDADGIYVCDSDGGYTPYASEWEEGYAAAQQDLFYQGNGGGSIASS
ncbi:hypothetical protein B0H13DRAFT_2261083 [Mycena leptocephala]|nr:hypothetical protein B0H13DRAFT_2261083 [Mycena leptocephala]